jgi:hypothetical protein
MKLLTPASRLCLCALALLLASSLALAQYSIDWHKISGGGGGSAGSIYAVSGTIGQPDAGNEMTNSQYSLTGGFWALPQAIQVTGAPTLTIAPATPGYVTISWTPDAPGFVLQETWNLSTATWTNSLSGSTNPITFSTLTAAKYFRLRK